MRLLVILGLLLAVRSASAGRHVVERGETLEHVARAYGCSTVAVLRANRLTTTLVPVGTVVKIPACRPRAQQGEPDDRARRALDVIDGARIVQPRSTTVRRVEPEAAIDDGPSESIGTPWNGRLHNGAAMPHGDGYLLRRPHKAFGASHVVGHLRRVIAEVRALHPEVHTLSIGDLSARTGGKLDRHVSHQSGLDVDVGLYYTAGSDVDLEAMWALITAFARTSHLATGVQVILFDHELQGRLYRWARKRGTPDDQLADILQYPRDKDVSAGLVRHWPRHADHLHVRFKPGD